jgi:hypothetical protein
MSVNRGTGAGGANTNALGLAFEEKTSNYARLLKAGYVVQYTNKSGSSRVMENNMEQYKPIEQDKTIFMTKGGLNTYMTQKFGVEMFREPDEAYYIKRPQGPRLKILEKKNQTMEGSVDTKLLAGPGFLEEYTWMMGKVGPGITVEYAFCVSSFLKEKILSDKPKWQALRDINKKYGITVLFGDDDDYFEKLDAWIQA